VRRRGSTTEVTRQPVSNLVAKFPFLSRFTALAAELVRLSGIFNMARPTTRTRASRIPFLALLSALLVALSTFVPSASAASLLAIDYGTDSFKASLVKPGVPFDVLLTKEGKRKVPTLVSIRGEDRFVGGDAANIVSIHGSHTHDRKLMRYRSLSTRRLDSLKTRFHPSSSCSDTLLPILSHNCIRNSSPLHKRRRNGVHPPCRLRVRLSPSKKFWRCSSRSRKSSQRSKRTRT
jgi:hypothetical protein